MYKWGLKQVKGKTDYKEKTGDGKNVGEKNLDLCVFRVVKRTVAGAWYNRLAGTTTKILSKPSLLKMQKLSHAHFRQI